MKKKLVALVSTLVSTVLFGQISAAQSTWESGTRKVPLIELYSSEGCSSCPPAEKWMAELFGNKDHFRTFTPINFHVDYWNQLGWTDRFSKSQFTDRQKQYANAWGTGRIYTPAFVVDGQDRGPMGQFEYLKADSAQQPGNLIVKKTKASEFEITFHSKEIAVYDVFFAELANGLKSTVTKGENEGKTLSHNFVVLRLSVAEMKNQKSTIRISDTEAGKPETTSIAVWVTKKGSLTPIQSVGGNL
jgi:hypothetical protein